MTAVDVIQNLGVEPEAQEYTLVIRNTEWGVEYHKKIDGRIANELIRQMYNDRQKTYKEAE